MSEPMATFRKMLGRDARDLELLTHRVRRLLGQLPAPKQNEAEDFPEEPDDASELRSTLQCVLADHLEPAVRVLGAAAQPRRAGGEPE